MCQLVTRVTSAMFSDVKLYSGLSDEYAVSVFSPDLINSAIAKLTHRSQFCGSCSTVLLAAPIPSPGAYVCHVVM